MGAGLAPAPSRSVACGHGLRRLLGNQYIRCGDEVRDAYTEQLRKEMEMRQWETTSKTLFAGQLSICLDAMVCEGAVRLQQIHSTQLQVLISCIVAVPLAPAAWCSLVGNAANIGRTASERARALRMLSYSRGVVEQM